LAVWWYLLEGNGINECEKLKKFFHERKKRRWDMQDLGRMVACFKMGEILWF